MRFEWTHMSGFRTLLLNGVPVGYISDVDYGYDANCEIDGSVSENMITLEMAKEETEKLAKKAAYNAAYAVHFFELPPFGEMLKEGW